jgi:hypothetical protein
VITWLSANISKFQILRFALLIGCAGWALMRDPYTIHFTRLELRLVPTPLVEICLLV